MRTNNKGFSTVALIAIIVVVVLAVLAVIFIPKLKGGDTDTVAADESYITDVANTVKSVAADEAVAGQTVQVDLKSRTGQVLTVRGGASDTKPEAVAAVVAALAAKYPDQFETDKSAPVAPSVDIQVYTSDEYMLVEGSYYGVVTITLNTDGTISYASATGKLSPTFAS